MSETLAVVANEDAAGTRKLAEQLLAQAKEQGVDPVGPRGLLTQLTKTVLETALEAEMTEHVGYEKHDPAGRGTGNSRNGTRSRRSSPRSARSRSTCRVTRHRRSSRRSCASVSAG